MTIFEADRPLLDAFRQGHRAALERVYRHYIDDVLTLVRRGFVSGDARVGGEPSVELQLDLAHDVFAKAFAESGRNGYDGLRPYRPYLLRIAKNHIIDMARKSGRLVPLLDAARTEDDLLEVEPVAPEEELHRERLRRATEEFVAEQPELHRRFIELRFVEGRSQYEVLEALGVSRRKIRTLESQVQAGLKKHLQTRGLKWS